RARRSEDGCAHHVFNFWGAVTGRFASSGVQLHNVKREGENIAEKFAAVCSGDPKQVRQFGPIMEVIGDALRAVPCARPEFRYLGMDYSGIESCVLAALVGERWKVEQWKKFFRTRDPHDDPYFIIGKWLGFADDIARDYGKIVDLAFGYGGSIGAWRRFAPPGDTTSDEQIKKYRDIWRQRHPATRQYLKVLDAGALVAVRSKAVTPIGRLTLYCQDVAGHNWFYIRLPSGRSIPYPFAEIKHYVDKDGRPAVGVGFMDYQSKKWQPYKSPTGHPVMWSGLLIENVTQGIARDLLAATLVRLWAENYPPTLHVHDEIVVEVPIGSEHSLDKYKELCERRPDWAVEMDIPVFAKVWERQRWAAGVDSPVQRVVGGVITPDQLIKLHKNKKPKSARTKVKRPPPDAPVVEEVAAPCSSRVSTAAEPVPIASEPAHICIHCRLQPPDGLERASAYNGAFLHPGCEKAFIRSRMKEEGISWENAVSPQELNNDGPKNTSEQPTHDKATATDFLAGLDPDEISATPGPATPELTLFINAHGALTKQFTLDADGNLVKTEGGQMAAGTARRIAIGDAQALADLIGTISSDQALALGSMRAGLPAQVTVITKEALNGVTAPDVISRSREYLTFGEGRRGFCLGDFDRKGITAEVQNKLEQSGGFVPALEAVIPKLKNTGYVVRASTSAGLFRTDTGQRFADSGGIHLYLQIKDVSDSKRFLKTLHDRCW